MPPSGYSPVQPPVCEVREVPCWLKGQSTLQTISRHSQPLTWTYAHFDDVSSREDELFHHLSRYHITSLQTGAHRGSCGVHVGSDDGDAGVGLFGVAECEGPLKVHLWKSPVSHVACHLSKAHSHTLPPSIECHHSGVEILGWYQSPDPVTKDEGESFPLGEYTQRRDLCVDASAVQRP
ncbi:hypothetical protein INR49_031769 [Caranx melampygus]|nr:hypothetical protein INR49_031769 [Caranx melampygus]